jgi:putative chitinase
MISTTQLAAAMPFAGADRIALFFQPLNDAMSESGITTAQRQAAFIAQVVHESGSLVYVRELADGVAYELRADLGNTQPGDGVRFKGRGLLQITGRANYAACGTALDLDLLAHPELLETPAGASRSAGWFWKTRGLNRYADSDSFGSLTKAINGGYTGIDDRIQHWLRARNAVGL